MNIPSWRTIFIGYCALSIATTALAIAMIVSGR